MTAGFGTLPGTLGCGDYNAMIQTRGGNSLLIAELPVATLKWGRVLDDTSVASVNLSDIDEECANLLSQVKPWRHELSIWRNSEEVWVGPIVTPSNPVDTFQIDARDISAWWDHRFVFDDVVGDQFIDLATTFQRVSDSAINPDNSMGLVLATTPSGVTGAFSVLAAQHALAGPTLRTLAQIGIDWTAIGRLVLAGGAVVPTGTLGPFVDGHFLMTPRPKLDGTVQANYWIVRGAGGGEAGDVVFGLAADTAASALDGLLCSVATDQTVIDNAAARSAAQTRTALASAPTLVEQSTLLDDAPFFMSSLIPGALCDIRLTQTIIPVNGTYRLQQIDVTKAADGTEAVTLTFQPPGTLDDASAAA